MKFSGLGLESFDYVCCSQFLSRILLFLRGSLTAGFFVVCARCYENSVLLVIFLNTKFNDHSFAMGKSPASHPNPAVMLKHEINYNLGTYC